MKTKLFIITILLFSSYVKSNFENNFFGDFEERISKLEEKMEQVQKNIFKEISLTKEKSEDKFILEDNDEFFKIIFKNVNPDKSSITTTKDSIIAEILSISEKINLNIKNNILKLEFYQEITKEKENKSKFYSSNSAETIKNIIGKLDFSKTDAVFSNNNLTIIIPKIKDIIQKTLTIKKK